MLRTQAIGQVDDDIRECNRNATAAAGNNQSDARQCKGASLDRGHPGRHQAGRDGATALLRVQTVGLGIQQIVHRIDCQGRQGKPRQAAEEGQPVESRARGKRERQRQDDEDVLDPIFRTGKPDERFPANASTPTRYIIDPEPRDPSEPGVNAGPSTAFGEKPDESGSALRRLNINPRISITH